jgi:hypothetical protein
VGLESADIETIANIDLDASMLFERAGLRLESSNEREVLLAERTRWLKCLAAGTVLIATDRSGEDVGGGKGFGAVADHL